MTYLKSVLELFGIVYMRFNWLPRIWCVWLVGVNAACLFYFTHIEAQVVLAITAIAVVTQTVLYRRAGFTRILGTAHALWLPMFAWMATRIDTIAADPGLSNWLIILAATNAVSLLVDIVDATRFARGERSPHYVWHQTA